MNLLVTSNFNVESLAIRPQPFHATSRVRKMAAQERTSMDPQLQMEIHTYGIVVEVEQLDVFAIAMYLTHAMLYYAMLPKI